MRKTTDRDRVGAAIVCVAIGLYIGLYLTNVAGLGGRRPDLRGRAAVPGDGPGGRAQRPASDLGLLLRGQRQRHATGSHDTTYELPAHTLVHVTIYQYDAQTGLRNPFISQATGTVGGTFMLNGKPTQAIDPTRASHVFAIPQLGVSVPLEGIPEHRQEPVQQRAVLAQHDHTTIYVHVPHPAPGLYRWQCFVPCAAGFIQGFGGPMQTVGYMDGFIKVV